MKSEEREDDGSESEHSESSSSQESNSNKWVEHTTRSGCKTGLQSGLYDLSTGKAVQFAVVQNYYSTLVELESEEVELNGKLANLYVEYSNVGAGIGGGFENTNELKPMKYDQAINGPDAKEWRAEIENEHDRMVKNNF